MCSCVRVSSMKRRSGEILCRRLTFIHSRLNVLRYSWLELCEGKKTTCPRRSGHPDMILGCWQGKGGDVSSLKRYCNVIKTTAALLAIRFFFFFKYCCSYLICLTWLLPQKCIPACSKSSVDCPLVSHLLQDMQCPTGKRRDRMHCFAFARQGYSSTKTFP